MKCVIAFVTFAYIANAKKNHECEPRKIIARGGKKHEVITTCLFGAKFVTEFQNGIENGKKTCYVDGIKESESHYLNGKKHGLVQIFDSLGNVVGIEHFHNGKQVDEIRRWHRPDQLSEVIRYDSSGRQDGLEQHWWPNGNLSLESYYVAGNCTLTTEYYRKGNRRGMARFFHDPGHPNQESKVISGESWSWSGQSIAKVVNGKGTLIYLPRDFEDTSTQWVGLLEEYQDSVVIKRTELDSLAIEKYR